MLYKLQKKVAISISSAYRTTSTKALMVVARTPPIDILADEREMVRHGMGRKDATKNCEPALEPWVNRKHGETDFHLTQFLTGHGTFQAYLHRFNLSDTEECLYCESVDDVGHTFFECIRWEEERKKIEDKMDRITPENIIDKMLENKEHWDMVKNTVRTILSTKRKDMEPREIRE